MKNPRYEHFRLLMKQYHRSHPWQLDSGLLIPHAYPNVRLLSWCDDVGFILNRRRVMVWWEHPRMKYDHAIHCMAIDEVKSSGLVLSSGLRQRGEKRWKKVGRSRKKVVGYRRAAARSDSDRHYLARLAAVTQRLQSEGIDFAVSPSMVVETLNWCTGISLCIPIEVRSKDDVVALAALAKKLIKRETTLADEFPGYLYGKDNWLVEAEQRDRDSDPRVLALSKAGQKNWDRK